MKSESEIIFERAKKVIPGGIYGHVAPAAGLPDSFPHYCRKATGYVFEDVDGKEWIDFMCGFGAILHGYANQEIDTAVDEQRKLGMVFNQPAEVLVDLAEALVEKIDFADWAVFAKNGSDLTTWAIRVAREKTQRKFIVKASGAYHGVDAWCDPGLGGRIASDRKEILEFSWNDLDELDSLFKKFDNQIAGVILTPYHHPAFASSKMPKEGFWEGVSNLCKLNESVLILDDVRTGGRIHESGSHRAFNFSPDMAVYSKALGNGYAISACAGIEELRSASSEVFLTGSCWNDATAMMAAIKSLEISKRDQVAKEVNEKGSFFCKKLENEAKRLNFPLKMTGPSSMPYPVVDDDPNLYKVQAFCRSCAREGLYFHPHHNWFISNAHTNASIEESVQRAIPAMERLDFNI